MSPQGVPYYFCEETQESRWVRPDGPQDIIEEVSPPPPPPKAGVQGAVALAGGGAVASPSSGTGPNLTKEQLGEPESWETIGKTGWLRVETEKGFKYFYHKKSKKTAWTCPEEIAKEVAELDGALGIPPEAPAAKGPGDGAAAASAGGPAAAPAKATGAEPAAETGQAKSAREEKLERKERLEEDSKAAKERDRLAQFKQLLIEKGVKPFDKYDKWLPKLLHEKRFTAVPGQKERKALFEALVKRIDQDRKKQSAATKRSGREVFKELLKKGEELGLFRDRTASAAQQAMEKRFGDDDRWGALPERERDRLIAEVVEETAAKLAKEKLAAHDGFRALILGALHGKDASRPPSLHRIEKKLKDDPRWEAMQPSSEREKLYEKICSELEEASQKRVRRQRQDEAEIENARKKRRMGEAEQILTSFFAERVKAPYAVTWEEVKSTLGDSEVLRKSSLREDDQVKIWEDYQRNTIHARRDAFLRHLVNLPADVVEPGMSFAEVARIVLQDPAAVKAFTGVPEDVLSGAWEEWREQAYDLAAEAARKWLQSCQHFHGTEDLEPTDDGPAMGQLLERLSGADVRFRRLAGRPEIQRRLVAERLKDLQDLRAQGHGAGDAEEEVDG